MASSTKIICIHFVLVIIFINGSFCNDDSTMYDDRNDVSKIINNNFFLNIIFNTTHNNK